MIDVFVSYSQNERERIRPIADCLRALKVEVWFDERLTPGENFTKEIVAVAHGCRVQLVCWSRDSVRSDWVRGEADIGRKRRVLIPALVERCDPLPPFNMLHSEDLSNWTGTSQHPGWLKVVEAIGTKLGRPGLAELSQLQGSEDPKAWGRWAEKYPGDPYVHEAWSKAEAFAIGAVREELARKRAATPQVQVEPEQPQPPVPPRIPPARRRRIALKLVLVTGVILVAAVGAFIAKSVYSPMTPSPAAVPATPAPTPPVKDAQITPPNPPTSPAPATPPRTPEPSGPGFAARRAIDQIPSRDWSIASAEALVRRLLKTVPMDSLKAAAEEGHGSAQMLLGAAHTYGVGGVKPNNAEALRLYRLAADRGDPRAQSTLGLMYVNGQVRLTTNNRAKNDEEAVRLYRLAAAQGNAFAQTYLGNMYASSRGVPAAKTNDHEAVRLYKLAAAQGNALGQSYLGSMYASKRGGLPKDDVEAVRLYKLAADQGNALGQTNLGLMYETGRGGVGPSDFEAVKLYELAANQRNARAQYYLGWMCEKGRGLPASDRARAVRLYQAAARQGQQEAQASLRRLGEKPL